MITNLVIYVSRQQVACAFPNGSSDYLEHRGIMAGLLAASKELLLEPEFQRLVASCELTPADVAELLSIAIPSDPSYQSNPPDNTIEV